MDCPRNSISEYLLVIPTRLFGFI